MTKKSITVNQVFTPAKYNGGYQREHYIVTEVIGTDIIKEGEDMSPVSLKNLILTSDISVTINKEPV